MQLFLDKISHLDVTNANSWATSADFKLTFDTLPIVVERYFIKHPLKGDAYSVQDYSITAAGYRRIRRTLFSFLFIYWLMDTF